MPVQNSMWPNYSWCPIVGPSSPTVILTKYSEYCHAGILLCNHIAFSEKPKCWREEKNPSPPASPTSCVLFFFFGPCIFIWTRLATPFSMDKIVAVFYTIGMLLFNPLIYTLRKAEVKNAMMMLWSKKLVSDDQRWMEIFQIFLHSLDWPGKNS